MKYLKSLQSVIYFFCLLQGYTQNKHLLDQEIKRNIEWGFNT